MPGELNDGPACRCSKKAKESGIRHGIYVGETPLPELDMHTNNWSKLYHYRSTFKMESFHFQFFLQGDHLAPHQLPDQKPYNHPP